MADTPNYNLPYPDDYTQLADVPAAVKALAEATDGVLDDKYEKPSGGIPGTDLSSGVQTSLGKADTAVQNTDYANGTTAGVFKTSSGYGTEVSTSGFLRGVAKNYSDYGNADTATIISKGTLDNVLTAVVGDIDSALDLINGEVIS